MCASTLALASLVASASAAMALCSWTGSLTSFLKQNMIRNTAFDTYIHMN